MPDLTIIEQCAPTLAGIKTGSLFSLAFPDDETAKEEIRALNRLLLAKGIRAVPIGKRKDRTLIYLYRPERLKADLKDPSAVQILKDKGYSMENENLCIAQLVKHVAKDSSFPHEIGLFLGYPPSDVKGFMNSPQDGVQCVGYWKVYGNRQAAEQTFQRYRKCTEIFRNRYKRGESLAQLAVG